MKNNIIKDKEAKSNLKYVFIGMILLLLIGVAVAQIGLFNINNLRLDSYETYGFLTSHLPLDSDLVSDGGLANRMVDEEQTIPNSYYTRIKIIGNNIIDSFNLEKVFGFNLENISDVFSEIESGELNKL